MEKTIFNKIALTKKSNSNNIQVNKNGNFSKQKKNTNNNKMNVTNKYFHNEKEKEKVFKKVLTNISSYNTKEKKIILNNNNHESKNTDTIIKSHKQHNEIEKDIMCNTERESINKNNNNNNSDKNSLKLLLSAKNCTKNPIFTHKNCNSDLEQYMKVISNDNKTHSISKNKSSKFFCQIKVTKNIKNELLNKNRNNPNNNYESHSKSKNNDKNKKNNKINLDISGDNSLLNSNKSFNHTNGIFSSTIKTQNNHRNNKTLNKKKKVNDTHEFKYLDVIFEDYKRNKNGENHHYLENTISAKNKMVKKKKTNVILPTAIDEEKFSKTNNNKFLSKKLNTLFNKDFQHEKTRNNQFKLNEVKSLQKLTDNNNIIKRNNSNNYKTLTKCNDNKYNIIDNMDNSKIFNGRIEDYLITKELGKGSCAVVKLAMHKITKEKFAIKIYTKEFLLDPQKRNVVKNEINILKQLDNEYIMKLYEEIDTPNFLYLVLEYINGTPLIDLLNNENKCNISQERATNLIIQITKGIIYLHSKQICHRDIKLENILVMKNDKIKIIDFGFAVKCNKDSYQKLFCGTPSYMAPEILNKKKYIPYYSDIWSLGVLFYAMIYGKFPFDFNNKEIENDFKEITEININFYEEINVSDDIKNIFKKIK